LFELIDKLFVRPDASFITTPGLSKLRILNGSWLVILEVLRGVLNECIILSADIFAPYAWDSVHESFALINLEPDASRFVATIVKTSGPLGNPGVEILPFPLRIDVPSSRVEPRLYVEIPYPLPEFSV
jgi:hypothetical protein